MHLGGTLPKTIAEVILVVVDSALGRLEGKSLADRVTAKSVVTNLFDCNDQTLSIPLYLYPAGSILSSKLLKGYFHFTQCLIDQSLVNCLINQVLASLTLG